MQISIGIFAKVKTKRRNIQNVINIEIVLSIIVSRAESEEFRNILDPDFVGEVQRGVPRRALEVQKSFQGNFS
jgi:hypothetical protein